MARLRVGILISGRGSNMQALIEACRRPGFPAEIALVLSNEAGAAGLARAQAAGIATRVLDHRDFNKDRPAFERALTAALDEAGVEFVCLAGFMRILSETFVAHWRDRLINIHPSLLPAFRGLDTHKRALEAGVRLHGCTVHFVRAAMDEGPIIVQAAVPVLPGDDEAKLAARVLAAEHRCYPLALMLAAEKRLRIEHERCFIDGAPAQEAVLINPPPLLG
ncbi:MAG TPA: phosphoribosylglycinamide formyltransferase [Alphaproteobacteria bacterium]